MCTSLITLAAAGWIAMTATSDIPWPEHPRPDFKREPWINLNGQWPFAFDPDNKGVKEQWFIPGQHKFDRTITVPFPWESKLSGIGDTEYKGVAWYQREITVPDAEGWIEAWRQGWMNESVWLVIGACDFKTKVWVNGQLATEHVGGYTPFEVNLSKFAKPGEKAFVIIRVEDQTNPHQPTGKQVRWYTRTSGIWQTVYLEPRGHRYIRHIRTVANPKTGEVAFSVYMDGSGMNSLSVSSPNNQFDTVSIGLSASGGDTYGRPREIRIKVRNPKPWTPESPLLYPAFFEIHDNLSDTICDRVDTYFGLREVSVGKAPGGDYQYIYLNGKPIYLLGALHQSFHPDGIYQYPDDATMRSDYELCKRIGLNFLRIHIKPPVPRELYWADKLGVMIMQDMPNTWEHSDQARKWWQETLEATVQRDFNHPATIAWCDFNETWGIGGRDGYTKDIQQWVQRMYELTKKLDPTRLVEENSPCLYDHVATDINSWHFYINDYEKARTHIRKVVDRTYPGSEFNFAEGYKQNDAPLINSEYGGISAGKGDQDISWCFKYLTNELRLHDKIGGYVYTELSDIEWEHNGFVNYDRSSKEYGYDFWQPQFMLSDLNNLDFIAIDAPPMSELKLGETQSIPVKISHFSKRDLTNATLWHRIAYLDSYGQWQSAKDGTQPAKCRRYAVTDQPALTLQLDKGTDAGVGVVQMVLMANSEVIAKNFVNFVVDRPAPPRVESVDSKTLALRFSPGDFATWDFAGNKPKPTDKVAGLGHGSVSYRLKLPDKIKPADIHEIRILAELASSAGKAKVDWPQRTKDVDYPQTDFKKKWMSDITLSINGHEIETRTLLDDPADMRGALSHYRGHQGSYGYLIDQRITGEPLKQALAKLTKDRTLTVQWEIKPDTKHVGGLAVFGRSLGCYPVDPTVILSFHKNHERGEHNTSDEPIILDRKQK